MDIAPSSRGTEDRGRVSYRTVPLLIQLLGAPFPTPQAPRNPWKMGLR